MKAKQLDNGVSEQSWILIFETGDEVASGLLAFAKQQAITAAHFTAIGAFSHATLGYFDWQTRSYNHIPVDEQAEVVTLIGDIALENDTPKIHAHVSLAKRGGVMIGGHLLDGHVRPTLEVSMQQLPEHLQRRFDPASGIALIRL